MVVVVAVKMGGEAGWFAQAKTILVSSRCLGYPHVVGRKVMERLNCCLCAFAR